MNDPLQTVVTFFEGFGQSLDDDLANMRRYLHPEVKFHTGVRNYDSSQEALNGWGAAMRALDLETFKVRLRHCGEGDGRVFVERWDDLFDTDGTLRASILIAAVLQIEDGLIVEWRDYFNPEAMREALASQIDPLVVPRSSVTEGK